jgi:putative endonuclease
MSGGFVYILGNQKPVYYVGSTSNLINRLKRHKSGYGSGFTEKYKTYKLLYFEFFENRSDAYIRERQLKNWHRDWKTNLVKSANPGFRDLYEDILKRRQVLKKFQDGADPEIRYGKGRP